MISIETEKRLSKLMMQLAEGERSIEISRQVLSDLYDFDAYQIFKNLDVEGKNRIDSNNIIDFLQNKGIYTNQEEAKLLILFYDQDFDGVLTYPEFINLVQSEKSIHKSPNFSPTDCLSFNIDKSLGKVLEKEIELSREILYILKELKTRYDFNIHDLYHSVKNFNFITPDSIRNFLEKNGFSYLESDIKSIIKRMDLNKDGKIDLSEFHVLLGYPNCSYCCPCLNCNNCGTCYCNLCFCNLPCYYHGRVHRNFDSPNRNKREDIAKDYYNYKSFINKNNYNNELNKDNYNDNNNDNNNYDYFKNNSMLSPRNNLKLSEINFSNNNNINNISNINNNSNRELYSSPSSRNNKFKKIISNSLSMRLSPERNYGPIEVDLCDNCNQIPCICGNLPNNYKNNSNNGFENEKMNKFNNNNSSYDNNNNLSSFEKKQFNDFLKLLMDGEKEIELNKIDLALKSDFNCEDAFRIFEKEGRGYITKEDLKFGFNSLGLSFNDIDINLIMKRFDLKKKNNINFQEFFDMMVPFDSEYRNIVELRLPLSNCPFRSFDVFSVDTMIYLKKVFISIIDFENKVNNIRKNLYGLSLKIKDIFKCFDTKNLGYFTFEDYILYLKKNGLIEENLKIDLLFIRLDKNRNGNIDIYEVLDELNE